MISWDHAISDGTGTLAHHLTVDIFNYQRAFGHEPKLIVIPYFRRDELDPALFEKCEIRGVPFSFSLFSDAIELCAQ